MPCLAEALRKATEWSLPLPVVSLDVRSAFDQVGVEVLARTLAARGASPQLVAAAVREHVHLTGTPSLAFARGSPVALHRGLRQGGPRMPQAWNHIVAEILADVMERWQGQSPAVAWAPEWSGISILVWADNFFLMTSSACVAAERVGDLERALSARGLDFSKESLKVLANQAAGDEFDNLQLPQSRLAFTRVAELEALGVALDATASTECMLQHRLRAARSVFCKVAPILQNPFLPTEERVRIFYQTVAASVLWGAGAWVPSIAVQERLSGQETRWLRRILCGMKPDEQPWVPWLRNTKSRVHTIRTRCDQAAIWHRVLAAVHGWMGHAARAGLRCPAWQVLSWRDAPWWDQTQTHGHFGLAAGRWRHPRQNWVRGAEAAVAQYHGLSWSISAVESREWWKKETRAFVLNGITRWGGPPQVPRKVAATFSREP